MCARRRNSYAMAAPLLLVPLLMLAVSPAAAQLGRLEIIQDPPPFVPDAQPMLMNMVNMMERVMNELIPQPALPLVAGPEVVAGPLIPGRVISGPVIAGPVVSGPVITVNEVARNESFSNESAEPPQVDVAVDIEVVPLGGPGSPLNSIILPIPRYQREPISPVSKRKGSLRKRHNATKSSAAHAGSGHRKVAILEVIRKNNSRPVLLPVPNKDVNTKQETKETSSLFPSSSSAAAQTSSKPVLRLRTSAEFAQQKLQDEGVPAVAASADSPVASSRRAPNIAKVSSAVGGAGNGGANNTDPTSSSTETGIGATCYALFVRHGLLLLVLAIICGISCLLGALLPVFCRRRRAQVSKYPPKRRFIPSRIFADPQMMRMFRRREHMMA